MAFIKDNQDNVMFGSDQVSLNYPDSLSRDLKGGGKQQGTALNPKALNTL